jgi:6-phosphogluconate dehydrogenase (decarboxylating)
MEQGMIGLRRTGANTVRRLVRVGHTFRFEFGGHGERAAAEEASA